MRRAGGYGIATHDDGRTVERDSFTCAHDNTIVFVRPGQDPSDMGGFCRLCAKHICASCASTGRCDPFDRKLERIEARDQLLRAAGG